MRHGGDVVSGAPNGDQPPARAPIGIVEFEGVA